MVFPDDTGPGEHSHVAGGRRDRHAARIHQARGLSGDGAEAVPVRRTHVRLPRSAR